MLLCGRERVRREVFKGQDAKGAHRTGSEGAALAILGYATIACAAYLSDAGLVTGALLGMQHTRVLQKHHLILQAIMAGQSTATALSYKQHYCHISPACVSFTLNMHIMRF